MNSSRLVYVILTLMTVLLKGVRKEVVVKNPLGLDIIQKLYYLCKED